MHRYTVCIMELLGQVSVPEEDDCVPLVDATFNARDIEKAIDQASLLAVGALEENEITTPVSVEIFNDEGFLLESFEVDPNEQ